MSPFLNLGRPALLGLATALKTNRLGFPVHAVHLVDYVPDHLQLLVAAELNSLRSAGMASAHLAYMLELLAAERASSQVKYDRIDLVWTGPEVSGSESRDTWVVVRELLKTAQHNVLISSFAVDQGTKGRELFRLLADRMDANPELQVRLFLNVKRRYQSTIPASTLLRQFSETFRQQIWPGQRLPEVFHDPRSLAMTAQTNACLHAKCVVVDEEQLLITSANFTEAAHFRNIEAGVLIVDPVTARAIRSQFEILVTQGVLCRVPGL